MSIRPDTQIHKSKMPKISDPQDDHQLIQARAGERVLTQSQNKTYEASHPNARSLPRVTGTYDSGGVVPAGVSGGAAPDEALVVAGSKGTTAGAVQPDMVRSDSPLADKGSRSQGTVAGQGDVGGKHVPIRGMVSTHTSNDDPLLDVSHPLGRLPSYETGMPSGA